MWWLLVKTIFKAVAMIVIGELLRPKPKFESPKPNSLGDFNFPTAQEGRTIPNGWGTFKCEGPNVTWYGDLKVEAIKQKQKTGLFSSTKVTVGYKYSLGVEHSICFGPIDDFISLSFDDKEVPLVGKTISADEITFSMDSKTLFGKEKEQGGVSGPVRVYRGTFTQTQNEYMRGVLGKVEIPAYRPICRVIFEHCYLGNAGTLPRPAFVVRRTPNPLGLTGGRHNLNGDANPANMVFEILTDKTWGMAIPESLIDTADFINVANTLAEEGLGLSMFVDNTQGGKELIAEIMRHIDGVLYQDFATGLYRIALVRDDYDAETALVLDETNIVPGSFEFGRGSWEDTQNTVIVSYVSREQNFTQRTVQVQNLANISARGGIIEAEQYDFLGFSNPEAAINAAARVLKTVSSPLSKVTLRCNRVAYTLRPGSVFKLSWSALGISSVIYRVTEIDYGTIEQPEISITAVEDIFSVSVVAFAPPGPSGWINPVSGPQPLAAQRLIEAPRAFYGDSRMVVTLGVRDGSQDLGYLVYADPAGGTAYTEIADVQGFTPTGVLTADYGASTHALDMVGFTIGATSGMDDLDNINAAERGQGDNLVLIDNELLAWTTKVNNGDGTYTFTGVLQGVLDTVPARHLAGTRVWFITDGFGLTSLEPYAADTTVQAKLRTYTVRETLPLDNAAAMSLTTVSRFAKPYGPSNVRVNGLYFRDAVIPGGTDLLALTWHHRDRLQQVGATTVLRQDAASVGPEAGVTYTIKLYGEDGLLKHTESGLTGTSYTWTTEAADSMIPDGSGVPGAYRLNSSGRVVIETWRDGVKALQDYDFNWTRPDAAPPVRVRVTDTGALRVTNTGSARIVE